MAASAYNSIPTAYFTDNSYGVTFDEQEKKQIEAFGIVTTKTYFFEKPWKIEGKIYVLNRPGGMAFGIMNGHPFKGIGGKKIVDSLGVYPPKKQIAFYEN